jgi:hypothetical protein
MYRLFLLASLSSLLLSCASHNSPEIFQDPYGFFSGVWHGMIFFFSLFGVFTSWIFSLIDIEILSEVEIIGRPNTGWTYYAGFILGLMFSGGSGAGGR